MEHFSGRTELLFSSPPGVVVGLRSEYRPVATKHESLRRGEGSAAPGSQDTAQDEHDAGQHPRSVEGHPGSISYSSKNASSSSASGSSAMGRVKPSRLRFLVRSRRRTSNWNATLAHRCQLAVVPSVGLEHLPAIFDVRRQRSAHGHSDAMGRAERNARDGWLRDQLVPFLSRDGRYAGGLLDHAGRKVHQFDLASTECIKSRACRFLSVLIVVWRGNTALDSPRFIPDARHQVRPISH